MTAPIITPGKNAVFQVGASYTDISSQMSDSALNRTKTLLEAVTTGGRSFAVGFENSSIDVGGPWEPTVDGQLNTIWALDTAQNFRFYPAGTGAGMPYYHGTALFTDYNLPGNADGQREWTGKFTVVTISRSVV
jgi:hypothetical protein